MSGTPGGEGREGCGFRLLERSELVSSLLSLIDEEDAVLLYKCSSVAERSPSLLAAMRERRHSLQQQLETLAGQLSERVQRSAQRLASDIEGEKAELTKLTAGQREAQLAAALDTQRRSTAVMKKHALVEKEFAIKDALERHSGELIAKYNSEVAHQMAEARAEKLRLQQSNYELQMQLEVVKHRLETAEHRLNQPLPSHDSTIERHKEARSPIRARYMEGALKEAVHGAGNEVLTLKEDEQSTHVQKPIKRGPTVGASKMALEEGRPTRKLSARRGSEANKQAAIHEEILRAELAHCETERAVAVERFMHVSDEMGIAVQELALMMDQASSPLGAHGALEWCTSGPRDTPQEENTGSRLEAHRAEEVSMRDADARRRRAPDGKPMREAVEAVEGKSDAFSCSESCFASERRPQIHTEKGCVVLSKHHMEYLTKLIEEDSWIESDVSSIVTSTPKLQRVGDKLRALKRSSTSAEQPTRQRWSQEDRLLRAVAKSALRPIAANQMSTLENVMATESPSPKESEGGDTSAETTPSPSSEVDQGKNVLQLIQQLRMRVACYEIRLRRARSVELELAGVFSERIKERLGQQSQALNTALDEARLTEAAAIMASELMTAYEKLKEQRAQVVAVHNQPSDPGDQARIALTEVLGKCAQLEKLLGLRERQLASLILNALTERTRQADRMTLAVAMQHSRAAELNRPITELRGRSYGESVVPRTPSASQRRRCIDAQAPSEETVQGSVQAADASTHSSCEATSSQLIDKGSCFAAPLHVARVATADPRARQNLPTRKISSASPFRPAMCKAHSMEAAFCAEPVARHHSIDKPPSARLPQVPASSMPILPPASQDSGVGISSPINKRLDLTTAVPKSPCAKSTPVRSLSTSLSTAEFSIKASMISPVSGLLARRTPNALPARVLSREGPMDLRTVDTQHGLFVVPSPMCKPNGIDVEQAMKDLEVVLNERSRRVRSKN